MRFYVDYRRLNEVTKKNSSSPRIDDTLVTLNSIKSSQRRIYKSGYWQVENDPNDKEKTAFST